MPKQTQPPFFDPAAALLSIKQQQQPPLQLPKLLNEQRTLSFVPAV